MIWQFCHLLWCFMTSTLLHVRLYHPSLLSQNNQTLLQVKFSSCREKKMLHHLSFLCLRGGTRQAEEDAKCLLVRTVEKGLKRVTHFLFLFLTVITYTAALIGPLIPLAVEKRSNTKTLLHSLCSLWNNAFCHPTDTPSLRFLQFLQVPLEN